MDSWVLFLQKRPFFPLLIALSLGILTKTDSSMWAIFFPFNTLFFKTSLFKKTPYLKRADYFFFALTFLCFSFGFIHPSTTLLKKNYTGTLYFHALESFKGKKIKIIPYAFVEKKGAVHKGLCRLPMQLYLPKELSGPPGFYAAKSFLYKSSKRWIAKSDWIELIKKSLWHKFRETLTSSLIEKTNRYADKKSASFLISLFTGAPLREEIDQAFTTLGLKHIVAISGFHLSLIAGFLLFFFSKLRSTKIRYGFCVFVLFFYLLFLGITPSLFRSFFMFFGLGCSIFLRKNFDTLNNFFATLFFQLVIEPYSLYNIGLQFSYLITFSLLSLYPFLADLLSKFFPPKHEEKHTISEKYLYVFERLFFHSCCLQLAVLLPGAYLSLYYFKQFNLVGLLYNAIIPLAAAFCLFFYTLGVVFIFIEPLFAFFIKSASFFAKAIVSLTTNAPFIPVLYLQTSLSKNLCLFLCLSFIAICLFAFVKKEQKNCC